MHTRSNALKSLILGLYSSSLLVANCLSANADLGEADVTSPGATTTGSEYDAWCGNSYKDCKVRFRDGRLVVDAGAGIAREQYKSVYYERVCRNFVFGLSSCYYHQMNKEYSITYFDSSGVERTAKISFRNEQAAQRFDADFRIWSGSVLRPIGPSIEVK